MNDKKENKFFKFICDIKICSIILLVSLMILSTSFVIMTHGLLDRKYVVGIPAMTILFIFGIISIIAMIVLGVQVCINDNYKHMFNLDKIYIEIRILIMLIIFLILLNRVTQSYLWVMWEEYLNFSIGYTIDVAMMIYHSITYMICDVVFVLTYVILGLSIIRSIKTKEIKSCTKNNIKKFMKDLQSIFNESKYKDYKFKQKLHKRQKNYLLSMLILGFLSGYCSFFTYDLMMFGFIFGILMIVLSIIFVLREDKMTDDVDKIIKQIEEISKGNLNSANTLNENSLLYLSGKELNEIQNGLQKSIEQKIKSERMKIELVTNVSHDLKTPLTSIISYIDLLSKEELSDECRDYVNILKNKSDRLKNMVFDLFTLAKVTSGEQKLDMVELDFTKLVEQTLADMEDSINASSLVLRVNITHEETKILGDGNKLYRSIQNILDNALKYSLKGTRIFLDIIKEDKFVVLILKNTSDIEITYTADEIIERFFRGDKSRTTEGNGLGLSIAKGFIESLGGTFEIMLDGDQFKVIIKLPLLEKEHKVSSDV